jgi:polyisoprenoid-binding protein YceI
MSVVENPREQLLSSGSWSVDPAHSAIEFRVKHMVIQTAPDGSERIALALRGHLNRSDYGLGWNRLLETGNVLVGDSIDLVLDVAAVRIS